MPKTKIAKPPKFAEPHTLDIPNEESYSELTAKPPYTHLRRILPQYVVSILLNDLHHKGKRYVRLFLPASCFAAAYTQNPPLFAKIVRQQRDCPFQYVVARFEKDLDRVRITASHEPEQKQSSYLGTCGATMLGEISKWPEGKSVALIYPYALMPRSYQNDQRVFRFRLERWVRQKLNRPEIEARLHIVEDGYRVTMILQK